MSKHKYEIEFPEEREPEPCALCERFEELTVHHLIPRSRHNKARMQRRFSKDHMRSAKALLCWPCHTNVHRVLSEQELGETYNTIEALREHPDVQKFTGWIRKKPVGFSPP